jgi:hypothetical protein
MSTRQPARTKAGWSSNAFNVVIQPCYRVVRISLGFAFLGLRLREVVSTSSDKDISKTYISSHTVGGRYRKCSNSPGGDR